MDGAPSGGALSCFKENKIDNLIPYTSSALQRNSIIHAVAKRKSNLQCGRTEICLWHHWHCARFLQNCAARLSGLARARKIEQHRHDNAQDASSYGSFEMSGSLSVHGIEGLARIGASAHRSTVRRCTFIRESEDSAKVTGSKMDFWGRP